MFMRFQRFLFVMGCMLVSGVQASPLHQALDLHGQVWKVQIDYYEDLQSVLDVSSEEIEIQKSGTGAVHIIEQPIGFEHSRATYHWDADQRMLTLHLVEDNQKYGTWISTFDARGCEVKTKIFLLHDVRKRTHLRTCDRQGRVLKEKRYLEGDPDPQILLYTHQKDGMVLVRDTRPGQASMADYTVYNKKGQPIETGWFSGKEKNPGYRYVYQYDQQGNWIRRTQYGWIAEEGVWGKAKVQVTVRTIIYF